jgi:hypothetical protein
MIRVTKAEVKEALGEREMTKEYCICRNCHYAFRITDEERKEYQDLRCGNCSTKYIYYAGYDVDGIGSIIDPEPTQPQEQYYIIITDDKGEKITVVKDVIKDACQFQLDADQLVVNNLEAENGKLQEQIKELEETALNKDEAEALLLALESYVFCLYGNKKLPDWAAKLQKIIGE